MTAKSKWVFFILFISLSSFTQEPPRVSVDDFSPAFGKWKGSLTYLDYSSGKPYTLAARVTLVPLKSEVIFAYEYPNEPKANGNDTLKITNQGMMLDQATVKSKRPVGEGKLEIVTESNGVDGNEKREALIKHTFTISRDFLSFRKDIKFTGENGWIKRNEYSFAR